ncbi:EAL domain-containing protein [Pseudidiomarina sp. CB1]|uniref:EAL domain-containing response regulator n=1 Tax=Pseudidiomarina sp. CB1 TaxID=2972484 RepID=UPI002163CB00|nr:EAL domain-containing response regulator [Pseudidiomarina sp. CB1]
MPVTLGRLLVLDDDQQVGMTIREMAQAAGYQAKACTQAETFFSEVSSFAPTHIVLDLAMPGLDGVEVMRQLASQQCFATIIIVSGLGEKVLNAAKTAADESGLRVAGVLPKPFRISALRALLNQYSDAEVKAPSNNSKAQEVSEAQLKEALAEHRLVAYLQPQISCQDRSVKGFEALVRWHDKDGSIITPDRFVGVAERSGLIAELTQQVFESAIRWFADHLGNTDYTLSLNTSASSFADTTFPSELTTLCIKHRLAPHRVKLEITETSTAENPSGALEMLTQLRVKGFALAIDDFGVGYSSLEQLVRQPFSELKIDKNFIIPLAQSEEAAKIVDALIALAQALKLTITAEGVEDERSLEILAKAGCDYAQGFYIGRPMAPEKLLDWLKEYRQSQPM